MRSILLMNSMKAGLAFTRGNVVSRFMGTKVTTLSKCQHVLNPRQVAAITSASSGHFSLGNNRYVSTTASLFRLNMARYGFTASSFPSTSAMLSPSNVATRGTGAGYHRGSVRLMSTANGQGNPLDAEQYVRKLSKNLNNAGHYAPCLHITLFYFIICTCFSFIISVS